MPVCPFPNLHAYHQPHCVHTVTTTRPGVAIQTRACKDVGKAYMYSTSPFQFKGDNKVKYERLMHKVCCICAL